MYQWVFHPDTRFRAHPTMAIALEVSEMSSCTILNRVRICSCLLLARELRAQARCLMLFKLNNKNDARGEDA
jgi:hypothetical protein